VRLTACAWRYTNASVAAKKKPKSRKAGLKDKGILIRVTAAQKQELATAAKREGLGLSSWMLTHALLAAQQVQWRADALRKKKRA
jgi:uncharacterized protein (DUF1778 family)